MDDGYWEVKRFAYVCVCITSEYHGSVTVWNTSEEAWKDAAWKLKKKKLLKQSRLILLQKTNITN